MFFLYEGLQPHECYKGAVYTLFKDGRGKTEFDISYQPKGKPSLFSKILFTAILPSSKFLLSVGFVLFIIHDCIKISILQFQTEVLVLYIFDPCWMRTTRCRWRGRQCRDHCGEAASQNTPSTLKDPMEKNSSMVNGHVPVRLENGYYHSQWPHY